METQQSYANSFLYSFCLSFLPFLLYLSRGPAKIRFHRENVIKYKRDLKYLLDSRSERKKQQKRLVSIIFFTSSRLCNAD